MNYLRIIQKPILTISSIRHSSTINILALIDSYPIEATVFEPKSPSPDS
ncbi:unnamed protein product, partial [Rotaria magnacalcarata]